MVNILRADIEDESVKIFIHLLKTVQQMTKKKQESSPDGIIPFDLRRDKIIMRVIDSKRQCLIDIVFPNTYFTEFQCLKEIVVCVNVNQMVQFLENTPSKTNILRIMFDDRNGMKIQTKVPYNTRSFCKDFESKEYVAEIEETIDNFDIPYIEYLSTTIFNVPLNMLKRDLITLQQFGECLIIEAYPVDQKVLITGINRKAGDDPIIEFDWEIEGVYAKTRYQTSILLSAIKNISNVFKVAKISYETDNPMVLTMEKEGVDLEVRVYLLPTTYDEKEIDRFIEETDKLLEEVAQDIEESNQVLYGNEEEEEINMIIEESDKLLEEVAQDIEESNRILYEKEDE